MVPRGFWLTALERAWGKRSVIWLHGVRRVGKTVLCRSLPDVEYLDCELPRTRRLLDDPEAFLAERRGRRLVLDEVHRLGDPSQILKIAADHFPETRVIATGSSTLGASRRFRDTLTGRKNSLWLTPALLCELEGFGVPNLDRRLLYGGLPAMLLGAELPASDFQEWMDSYWAKDILELFRLERRHSFQRLVELVLARSGGIFEATWYARACEVSRTTISNYLGVLEATFVAHLLRPYNTHRASEIVAAPKVYGFDTGFVCYHRGINELRAEDRGLLWEHIVLNELHGHLQTRAIHYWRSKAGHEVDFIVAPRSQPPAAIECKWSAGDVDLSSLKAFRRAYPEGASYVVAHDVAQPYTRAMAGVNVRFLGLHDLVEHLAQAPPHQPA